MADKVDNEVIEDDQSEQKAVIKKPTLDEVDINNAIILGDNTKLMNLAHQVFWMMADNAFKVAIGERTLSVYNPKYFPHTQQIANMFGINIHDESEPVVNALLKYPIFSKAYLGTMAGVTKSLESVLQNIEIKTHDNTPGMAPYTFTVRADNSYGLDQNKAIELINRFACLRDNTPELVLIAVICDSAIAFYSNIISKKAVILEFDKGVCDANYQLPDADSSRQESDRQ